MSDPKEELGAPEDDPRNKSDADYETMPGTFDDSARNLPGDQPLDDSPPSKTLADETRTRDELND